MANVVKSAAVFLVFIVAVVTCESILCSKCDSHHDRIPGDCEKRPPSPTSCNNYHVRQLCMKVIEYAKDGSKMHFVRDCTPLTEGTCTESKPDEIASGAAFKTCHEVCDTDGCNGSTRLLPISVFILSVPCLAVTAYRFFHSV